MSNTFRENMTCLFMLLLKMFWSRGQLCILLLTLVEDIQNDTEKNSNMASSKQKSMTLNTWLRFNCCFLCPISFHYLVVFYLLHIFEVTLSTQGIFPLHKVLPPKHLCFCFWFLLPARHWYQQALKV